MNGGQKVEFLIVKPGCDMYLDLDYKCLIYVLLHWTALHPQGTKHTFLYKWCLSAVEMYALC